MTRRQLIALVLLPVLALGALVVACGNDDDGDANGNGIGANGATEIDVGLSEWAVAPSQASAPAGSVTFIAENRGPDEPHELVIVRTDLGPLDLPFEDDQVPEDQIDIAGEIEPFDPGNTASLTVDLTAGSYLLICNITDEIAGEVVSHYRRGMVATFSVE